MKHNSSRYFGSYKISNEANSKEDIKNLLASWGDQKLLGFNWTTNQIMDELKKETGTLFGFSFKDDILEILILYKEIRPEAEIYLVLKAKGTPSEVVVKTLRTLLDTSCHIKQWWLEVHERNHAAIKLYERVGFHLKAMRKKYYPDGGHALIYVYNKI